MTVIGSACIRPPVGDVSLMPVAQEIGIIVLLFYKLEINIVVPVAFIIAIKFASRRIMYPFSYTRGGATATATIAAKSALRRKTGRCVFIREIFS